MEPLWGCPCAAPRQGAIARRPSADFRSSSFSFLPRHILLPPESLSYSSQASLALFIGRALPWPLDSRNTPNHSRQRPPTRQRQPVIAANPLPIDEPPSTPNPYCSMSVSVSELAAAMGVDDPHRSFTGVRAVKEGDRVRMVLVLHSRGVPNAPTLRTIHPGALICPDVMGLARQNGY